MNIKFVWQGVIAFILPMLINVAFVLFPPQSEEKSENNVSRPVEIVEKVTRIAYLFAMCVSFGEFSLNYHSVWLYAALLLLVLYYAVWIRYFACGRKVSYLKKTFLFVPMPLAVFPTVYFLCAAIWLENIPAAVIAAIFGAAHITVSVQSFKSEKSGNNREDSI